MFPAKYLNFTHVTESLRVGEAEVVARNCHSDLGLMVGPEDVHLQRDSLVMVLVGFPALLGVSS